MTADSACHDCVALVEYAQLTAVFVHHEADIIFVIVVNIDTEVLSCSQQIQNFFQI
jgi:hypothetical protein